MTTNNDLKPSFCLPSKSALVRTSFSIPQRIIRDYVKLIPLSERREGASYVRSLWQVDPQLIDRALKEAPHLKALIDTYHKNSEGVNAKRWHGYLAYILVDALNLFQSDEKEPDGSIPRCIPFKVRRCLFISKLKASCLLYKDRDKDASKQAEIPLQMTYHENTLYACWTALSVNTDKSVGGAKGIDHSEIDEIFCPFRGYVNVGISAPEVYKSKQIDKNPTLQKNVLCQQFYYKYNWELEKAGTKEAWYLMYFENYSYAQLSAHFGYSARSTFCMKFSRLHKAMEKWLKKPIEGKEAHELEEIYLTKADKYKELYSAFFKRIDWSKRANQTERQVYICFHFLGWTPQAIAEEFLLHPIKVKNILVDKWGEVTMLRYLKDGILDCLPCKMIDENDTVNLTLHERLPHTPKAKELYKQNVYRIKALTLS